MRGIIKVKLLNKIKGKLLEVDNGLKYKYGVTRFAMSFHKSMTEDMFDKK